METRENRTIWGDDRKREKSIMMVLPLNEQIAPNCFAVQENTRIFAPDLIEN